jgi:catechol O-methyltransferase
MQMWRFFSPRMLGFTLRNISHAALDTVLRKPSRPLQAMDYVARHAQRGDPDDVLRTLDRFATEERWLMSIGPMKDQLIREVIETLPSNPRVLEFGAYCGYSSILIGKLLGDGGSVISVEINEGSVTSSRANVEMAGLSDQVTFIHGSSSETIPTLQGTFDLVFLDHWKDLYLPDLKLLEQHGLLRNGSIVVADNVGEVFGEQPYLDYVRSGSRYQSENRVATIEYTDLPDAVEISTYTGSS